MDGNLTLPMWAVSVFAALGLGLIRVLDGVSSNTKDLKGAIEGLREVVANHHTEIALLKATKVDK
jgi:hypothetical protein